MENGIVLIAVGNPYFGKQAYNLAATLKASEKVDITLIYDEQALSHLHPLCHKVFDQKIKSPLNYTGFEAAMELRMLLPKLTPYQKTLSLDVDMVWLGQNRLAELFDLLTEEQDITYVNEGYFSLDGEADDATKDYLPWAHPAAIKEAYDITGKLYQMRGEFILFRKSQRVVSAFKAAQKIRKKPKIEPYTLGGSITEEFALNIAFNQHGIEPHISKWPATYWPYMNGGYTPPIKELRDKYYGLSAGGNIVSTSLRTAYNTLVEAACNKLGLPHFFPLQAKRNNLPERLAR